MCRRPSGSSIGLSYLVHVTAVSIDLEEIPAYTRTVGFGLNAFLMTLVLSKWRAISPRLVDCIPGPINLNFPSLKSSRS